MSLFSKVYDKIMPVGMVQKVEACRQARDKKEDYYFFNKQNYKITTLQKFYSYMVKELPILLGIIFGLTGSVNQITDILILLIRAMVGATIGIMVSALFLRLFIIESNKSKI